MSRDKDYRDSQLTQALKADAQRQLPEGDFKEVLMGGLSDRVLPDGHDWPEEL
jgi:hypothetical protein